MIGLVKLKLIANQLWTMLVSSTITYQHLMLTLQILFFFSNTIDIWIPMISTVQGPQLKVKKKHIFS